jgi:hypothetical protein
MICPQCRSEYREGFTHCADCDVDLVPVAEPDPTGAEPDIQLVKIYEGGDAAVLPVVESVLRDSGIEFLTRGEALQDLFALGRFGTGSNNAIGPVEFWVRAEDEATARELLAGALESGDPQ